jgi:rhodanese-related sulfurtransferase
MEPRRISVEEVKSAMDQEHAPVFVDARSADAFAKATEQIPGSIRVPPDEAPARLGAIPRGRPVVAYCT